MNEKYAFFAESTTIEYTVERNCEVTSVSILPLNIIYTRYQKSMNLI